MKRKLNVKRIIICIIGLLVVLVLGCMIFFASLLGKVNDDTEVKSYTVSLGKGLYEVIDDLESEGYIKSALALKIYSKFKGNAKIDAGVYEISKSYSAIKIYDILTKDNTLGREESAFIINEGDTVSDIIESIALGTETDKEEVKSIINDKEYLKELIDAYWFLTDDILADGIYYPLEGYLYPDTYKVFKDATVKDYIEKVLENTKNKLEGLKSEFEKSDRSVHEILTLASIIEREGLTLEDKKIIAGVFYNRIESGMTLGSDVTTYYANNVKVGSRDLTDRDLNNCDNKYNTRCSNVSFPVGPICSPTLDSIKATLEYEDNNYYYFVADKYGNIYPSKTYVEHDNTISRLKSQGLWYEFE